MEAAFSYRPGIPCYGKTFTRASTANYADDVADVTLVYWPGELHNVETFARASVARYVAHEGYPE